MRKCLLSNQDKLFSEIANNAKLYIPVDGPNGTVKYAEYADGLVMSNALKTVRSA